MRNILNTLIMFVLAFMLFSSCEVTNSEEFVPEYFVESYQFAMEPLQPVRLSRTVAFDQAYNFEAQAVRNASVKISMLDNSGNVEQVLDYAETSPGVYMPADTTHRVQPRATYLLEALVPGDENVLVRSQTTIPDTFRIVDTNADTLIYQATDQLEIVVTQSFVEGRQNVFVFSTEAFDIRFDNLTPLFFEFLDEGEDDLEDFRVNESPPVNEGNYDLNPDGTLTIKLPWLAVVFYGQNKITANAIDDNIFDFVIGSELQVNPSTLSPGEIPNIVDHVENGTGIFGSYARITDFIYIQRQ